MYRETSIADLTGFVPQKRTPVNFTGSGARGFSYILLMGFFLMGLLGVTAAGFRLNLTPSMPTGFYRLVTISPEAYRRGMTIAVCPPVDAPFLPRGICHLGMQPLLKEIAGVPGDEVTVTREGVRINGGPLLPRSAPLDTDSSGNPLPRLSGTWRLTGYWLYGRGSPRSFDSRYFGEVPADAFLGAARPVFLFQEKEG